VPVKIRDIIDSKEEVFRVEGMEVGMVAVVGIVDSIENQVALNL
jgi:hypothetical protein